MLLQKSFSTVDVPGITSQMEQMYTSLAAYETVLYKRVAMKEIWEECGGGGWGNKRSSPAA